MYNATSAITSKMQEIDSPVHPDLKRVKQITALGAFFKNTLSYGPHVHLITAKTAASLYALKTLRCHGLDGHALWGVT